MRRTAIGLMLVLGLFVGAAQTVGATEKAGYLGVGFTVDSNSGLLTVARVAPDSPAEAAGIREFDVLTSVAGTEVRFASHRQALASVGGKVREGVPVELTFQREGRTRSVVVVPGVPPVGLATRNEAALRCADFALTNSRANRQDLPP